MCTVSVEEPGANGKVIGTVIEAEVDKSRGTIATLLIQNGTLQAGDIVVAGTTHGKLRAITDFKGKPVKKAGPATPVSVLGLNEVPAAGDIFQVVGSEREARQIVTERLEAAKSQAQARKKVQEWIEELRKKIEPNPSSPKYVLTEPWVGYRFADL